MAGDEDVEQGGSILRQDVPTHRRRLPGTFDFQVLLMCISLSVNIRLPGTSDLQMSHFDGCQTCRCQICRNVQLSNESDYQVFSTFSRYVRHPDEPNFPVRPMLDFQSNQTSRYARISAILNFQVLKICRYARF